MAAVWRNILLVLLCLATYAQKLQCCPCNWERKEADCSRRNLTRIPEGLPGGLEFIDLSGNLIKNLSEFAFKRFSELKGLTLTGNKIEHLPEKSLRGIPNLKQLHLDDNALSAVPTHALRNLKKLVFLNLNHNNILEIPSKAFEGLRRLETLNLFSNNIGTIANDGFEGLESLTILDLKQNNLTSIPVKALVAVQKITVLELKDNPITDVPDEAFARLNSLSELTLTWEKITTVHPKAFAFMPALRSLTLSIVKLKKFPNLTGTTALQVLTLTDCHITSMPQDICQKQKHLTELTMNFNSFSSLPDFSGCKALSVINLEHNRIDSIESSFKGMKNLKDLTLKGNKISRIRSDAFEGTNGLETLNLRDNDITLIEDNMFASSEKIKFLSLQGNKIEKIKKKTLAGLKNVEILNLAENKITSIDIDAFSSFERIRELDLGLNSFPSLPSRGLETLVELSVKGNRKLEDFPAEELRNIRKVEAYYPYHCCRFRKLPQTKENSEEKVRIQEKDVWKWDVDTYLIATSGEEDSTNMTDFDPLSGFGSGQIDSAVGESSGIGPTDDMYTSGESYDHELEPSDEQDRKVNCTPFPDDPFFPCDDLMDSALLRYGVWIVFLLALLGNAIVIVVIIATRSRMDVPRFLICNLAFADLCMGVYLGMLAFVDTMTRGNFKSYGVQWQLSPGCSTAGFLAVLSSESSVFTLAVITIERKIAITHALDVTRKLSLRKTVFLMAIGWCFAIVMATLPLFEISDYSKFSVCLPFEISNPASLGYVTFLLLANCSAFIVILSCYIKIYSAIRGSNAWNTNDWRVAQRMSLLVITDFFCWAPIVFLSLTAAFGSSPLVSLPDAKIFTVFVFPLNSCANPFLYAITTSQFKKDCMFLCRRVKHSPVSRIPSVRRKFSLTPADVTRSTNTTSSEGVFGKYRVRELRRNSVPAAMKFSTALTTPSKSKPPSYVEKETSL